MSIWYLLVLSVKGLKLQFSYLQAILAVIFGHYSSDLSQINTRLSHFSYFSNKPLKEDW